MTIDVDEPTEGVEEVDLRHVAPLSSE